VVSRNLCSFAAFWLITAKSIGSTGGSLHPCLRMSARRDSHLATFVDKKCPAMTVRTKQKVVRDREISMS
jgi:hypothetical protein